MSHRSSEYGPEHPCPICGAEVQMYSGGRVSHPVLVESNEWGDLAVHRHRGRPVEPLDRYLECLCGVHVVERPLVGTFNRDGSAHRCRPMRGEPVAVADPSDEMPKGVIGWGRSLLGRAKPKAGSGGTWATG